MGDLADDAVRVDVTVYTVTRLADDSPDHMIWSVTIEAVGGGRWAVRNMGRCLNRDGEWEREPSPSNRADGWLETVRWDDVDEAIAAARAAEPEICWNGLRAADVHARHMVEEVRSDA